MAGNGLGPDHGEDGELGSGRGLKIEGGPRRCLLEGPLVGATPSKPGAWVLEGPKLLRTLLGMVASLAWPICMCPLQLRPKPGPRVSTPDPHGGSSRSLGSPSSLWRLLSISWPLT